MDSDTSWSRCGSSKSPTLRRMKSRRAPRNASTCSARALFCWMKSSTSRFAIFVLSLDESTKGDFRFTKRVPEVAGSCLFSSGFRNSATRRLDWKHLLNRDFLLLEGHARPLLREAQCASGSPEEEVQSGYPRMKVRHQYGAKRVFKPLIGARFFLSAACCRSFLERREERKRRGARRGSDAARGDRRAARGSSPGGR
ncbi:hypothetical protein EYF80_055196 [Liparis tanakae]|uniref:Uncharacterized protein n=1 Tax=Liparis tanakae TaxID=230148 RepID=A0A4Z2F1K8_9TELE|nr:hypothetical protein EYF80_055196 [Liparis tanakae]